MAFPLIQPISKSTKIFINSTYLKSIKIFTKRCQHSFRQPICIRKFIRPNGFAFNSTYLKPITAKRLLIRGQHSLHQPICTRKFYGPTGFAFNSIYLRSLKMFINSIYLKSIKMFIERGQHSFRQPICTRKFYWQTGFAFQSISDH